jgi:hypothetical protein
MHKMESFKMRYLFLKCLLINKVYTKCFPIKNVAENHDVPFSHDKFICFFNYMPSTPHTYSTTNNREGTFLQSFSKYRFTSYTYESILCKILKYSPYNALNYVQFYITSLLQMFYTICDVFSCLREDPSRV